jgi:hypothetical protein
MVGVRAVEANGIGKIRRSEKGIKCPEIDIVNLSQIGIIS